MINIFKVFISKQGFCDGIKSFKYRSSQAVKLVEINSRYNIFKPGNKVVDLGSSPGGWSQVAAQRTGSTDQNPLVYSIDYLEMDPIPGAVFIQGDIIDKVVRANLVQHLDMKPVEIILCDLDFERKKDQDTNSLEMSILNKQAIDISLKILKPGGTLLMKTLKGAFEPNLKKMLIQLFMDFQDVSPITLELTDDLHEIYYLGQGFKLTDSYTKNKSFYEKFFGNKMDQIKDHEIPPEIVSQEEMIQSILEFLRDANEQQFLVEVGTINQIKAHPSFADLDWSKLNLNISMQLLTEEEQQEIFQQNTQGQYTFNPKKYQSLEEVELKMAEYKRKSNELKMYRRRRDQMLLDDEEILGENQIPKDLEEFAKEMDQEFQKDWQKPPTPIEEETDVNKMKLGRSIVEENYSVMDNEELRHRRDLEIDGLEQFKKDHINGLLKNAGIDRDLEASDKHSEDILRKTMKGADRRTKEYRNKFYQKDTPFGRKIK